MRFLTTTLIATLFISTSSSAVFGVVDSSYDKLVIDEIEYNRKLKLTEKQIEVLARLERMSSPQTTVNTTNTSSFYSSNKASNKASQAQETEVSK